MSVSGQMVRGSFWMISMNWSFRILGLANIIILARLLTPEDFGVVAMALVVMTLITRMSDMGVDLILIRESEITDAHYNTAWTLWLLQNVALGLALLILAPLGGAYFGDQRVSYVIASLSLVAFIQAARNIGVVDFRKHLNFNKEFKLNVWSRFSRVLSSISLALILRNYWAIVFGYVIGMAVEVVMSYLMHAYRPKFSIKHWKVFLNFSIALIGIRLGQFLSRKIDVLVIGKIAATGFVGTYHLAIELSRMIVNDLVAPVGHALFPGFSKIRQSGGALQTTYLDSIGALAAIVVPAGIGLSAVSEQAVSVFFGAQWESAVPLLELLALFCLGEGIIEIISSQILLATHRERRYLGLAWIRTISLSIGVVVSGTVWGASTVPLVMVWIVWLLLPVFLLTIAYAIDIPAIRILSVFARPMTSSLLMYALLSMEPFVTGNPYIDLVTLVMLGATAYLLLSIAIWILIGRPDGYERHILTAIRNWISTRSRAIRS